MAKFASTQREGVGQRNIAKRNGRITRRQQTSITSAHAASAQKRLARHEQTPALFWPHFLVVFTFLCVMHTGGMIVHSSLHVRFEAIKNAATIVTDSKQLKLFIVAVCYRARQQHTNPRSNTKV